jgi:hypothetical protein
VSETVIESVSDLPPGTLGFRASGKLSNEKLNIYFELADDFHGLDWGAVLQDIKAAGSIGLKHRSSWQRMALVTNKDWVKHGATAFGWLAPGELRLFEPHERETARAWLAETSSV